MSDAASIEAAVREALGVIRPNAVMLDADADLANEADLDSAEVMDLVMEIEDRLDLFVLAQQVPEEADDRATLLGLPSGDGES